MIRDADADANADAFLKFVERDNKLKEKLSKDVEGLLSLYEAAHVRIQKENVLEEAVAFTTNHLTRMLPQMEPHLKQEVEQALKDPLHKSLTIFNLPSYINIYENKHRARGDGDGHGDGAVLLRLAKLNFNFMQNVFKNELFQLTT